MASGALPAPKSSWGPVGLSDSRPPIAAGIDAQGYTHLALVCVIASWLTTEYVAQQLHYARVLGPPLAPHVYLPGAAIWWWLLFGAHAGATLGHLFALMWCGVAFGVTLGVVGALNGTYDRRRRALGAGDSHGSAHWATRDEVWRMGLLPTHNALYSVGVALRTAGVASSLARWLIERGHYEHSGLYVGAWTDPNTKRRYYLRHEGPEHVMVTAPTRSGKGIGIVLPALLGGWAKDGSSVVIDIKGENWHHTAGYRNRLGHRVVKFEPMAAVGSVRWNPLDMIELGTPHEIEQTQQIVDILVDPEGRAASGPEAHWIMTGSALLVGAILHLKYMAGRPGSHPATLRGLLSLLSDPAYSEPSALYRDMLIADHDPFYRAGWTDMEGNRTKTHPVIAECMADMLSKQGPEASGVRSTAVRFLKLYWNPIIAANVSRSDFAIEDLVNGENPMDLYIIIPPAAKHSLKPLTRLLVNAIFARLTKEMRFSDGPSDGRHVVRHRLLMLLDEACSGLGRLEIVPSTAAYAAGYGIRIVFVVQDSVQLHETYGRDESITSNCHVRIAFTPNRVETAQLLSQMIGRTTVHVSEAQAGRKVVKDHARDLVTPDEIMRMPSAQKDRDGRIVRPGDELLFVSGNPPIYATQIVYAHDPVFAARAAIPPPAPTPSIVSPDLDSDQRAPAEESDAFGEEVTMFEDALPTLTPPDARSSIPLLPSSVEAMQARIDAAKVATLAAAARGDQPPADDIPDSVEAFDFDAAAQFYVEAD